MRFYVLTIGGLSQYKYAWCEPCYDANGNFRTSDEYPTCGVCGDAIGLRRWLPPHRVDIKQPRVIGDFLYGVFNFAVTETVKFAYENSQLTGNQAFYPLEIARVGTQRRLEPIPALKSLALKSCMAELELTTIDQQQNGGSHLSLIIAAIAGPEAVEKVERPHALRDFILNRKLRVGRIFSSQSISIIES